MQKTAKRHIRLTFPIEAAGESSITPAILRRVRAVRQAWEAAARGRPLEIDAANHPELASNGVNTVLFARQPSDAEFHQFTEYQAIGLAGTSRGQSPEWMEQNPRPVFEWLKRLGAPSCHYKVRSTFDSAPATGSIGRATDIDREVFAQSVVPLIAGIDPRKPTHRI